MMKRLFDIVFSSLVLILFLPLLLTIALVIKLTSKGSAFYRGKRVGLGGNAFLMYKFRTMLKNADKIGGPTTSADDPRITRIGSFLRKYKLDELPQFMNVLKGEMSVVGPRPDVEEVVKLLKEKEKKIIFSVKPGITDFASIAFPNEGEIVKKTKDPHKVYLEKIWPEKIRLQMKYVKKRTFWVDMKVILKTIKLLMHKRPK